MKTCVSCSYKNEPIATHCTRCGQVLLTVPDPPTERQRLAWKLRPRVSWGDLRLPPQAVLVLYIFNSIEPVCLPRQAQIRIGRSGASGLRNPDVDLTPFNAREFGVSRLHAAIDIQAEAVFITDLGSTNGTHLNAVLLSPGEPKIVSNGDEICLGNLLTHLYFRKFIDVQTGSG